eukprot:TRINITY_DN4229_c0_g1_i3.p1 TRINITY_DN4229_c0_g1~~TRINITY_DN4229_c0_g1_i3.p1  ORF type:complete len:1292 (-),score=410.38 TRINITY_DN4229_c0_g1_i3:149-4024(-)
MQPLRCFVLAVVLSFAFGQDPLKFGLPNASSAVGLKFNANGFWFQCPFNVKLVGIHVQSDQSDPSFAPRQFAEVVLFDRFLNPPYSNTPLPPFTSLFRTPEGGQSSRSNVTVSIPISAGSTIGIVGCAGSSTAVNETNPPNYYVFGEGTAFTTALDGASIKLVRLLGQSNFIKNYSGSSLVTFDSGINAQLPLIDVYFVPLPTVTESADIRALDDLSPFVIRGRGFASNPTAISVILSSSGLGNPGCVVVNATSTAIFCVLNGTLNGGYLNATVVSYGDASASTLVATIMPSPRITYSTNPVSHLADSVTILGTNFGINPGENTLDLVAGDGSSIRCLSVVPVSSRQLVCHLNATSVLPLGPLSASVVFFGVSSGAFVQFANVTLFPAVSASGQLQTQAVPWVVIEGLHFSPPPYQNAVNLSSASGQIVACESVSTLAGYLNCSLGVPVPLGRLSAVVTSAEGLASPLTSVAEIVPVPAVTFSMEPWALSLPVFSVYGTAFNGTAATTVVSLSGLATNVSCTVLSVTSTEIQCALRNVTVGSLYATVTFPSMLGGSTGEPVQVATVVYPPSVNATSTVYADSAVVSISGRHFGPSSTVVLSSSSGGTPLCALIAVVSNTSVLCKLSGASPGNLSAAVLYGGASSGFVPVAVLVHTPHVNASTLRVAGALSGITIRGMHFAVNTSLTVNEVCLNSTGADQPFQCAQVTTLSSTALNCTFNGSVPLGLLSATVTAFGGQSNTAQVARFVGPPFVTNATTRYFYGAPSLTIDGGNFLTDADTSLSLSVNGSTVSCSGLTVSASRIVCTLSDVLPLGALTASVTLLDVVGLASTPPTPVGVVNSGLTVLQSVRSSFAGRLVYMSESFGTGASRWKLGPEWQIGPPVAAGCPQGSDPASDHTPDNALAGVLIGGCAGATNHSGYYLTSPAVNTATASNVTLEFYRFLGQAPLFMVSTVEVSRDGANWTTVLTYTGRVIDSSWQQIVLNVSDAHAGAGFSVRWGYSQSVASADEASQWSVDDITVTGDDVATRFDYVVDVSLGYTLTQFAVEAIGNVSVSEVLSGAVDGRHVPVVGLGLTPAGVYLGWPNLALSSGAHNFSLFLSTRRVWASAPSAVRAVGAGNFSHTTSAVGPAVPPVVYPDTVLYTTSGWMVVSGQGLTSPHGPTIVTLTQDPPSNITCGAIVGGSTSAAVQCFFDHAANGTVSAVVTVNGVSSIDPVVVGIVYDPFVTPTVFENDATQSLYNTRLVIFGRPFSRVAGGTVVSLNSTGGGAPSCRITAIRSAPARVLVGNHPGNK